MDESESRRLKRIWEGNKRSSPTFTLERKELFENKVYEEGAGMLGVYI